MQYVRTVGKLAECGQQFGAENATQNACREREREREKDEKLLVDHLIRVTKELTRRFVDGAQKAHSHKDADYVSVKRTVERYPEVRFWDVDHVPEEGRHRHGDQYRCYVCVDQSIELERRD